MAVKLNDLSQDSLSKLREIIAYGKGELVQTIKINKGFFQSIDDYEYILDTLEHFFQIIKSIKEIPEVKHTIELKKSYLNMNNSEVFKVLTKKGVIIKYRLNKISSDTQRKLITDNMEFLSGSIRGFAETTTYYKKTIKRLSVESVFKKSWW